VDFDN